MKLFHEGIREKKKAGNGINHKTGRGVKQSICGALRTPCFLFEYSTTKRKAAPLQAIKSEPKADSPSKPELIRVESSSATHETPLLTKLVHMDRLFIFGRKY
jgi:hypothetical protein